MVRKVAVYVFKTAFERNVSGVSLETMSTSRPAKRMQKPVTSSPSEKYRVSNHDEEILRTYLPTVKNHRHKGNIQKRYSHLYLFLPRAF
jgi:hypothetical protein